MKTMTIEDILNDYQQYLTDYEVHALRGIQLFPSNFSSESLKLALFGEEWDFMTADKSNPWSQEYTDRVNRKRNAFGVSAVDEHGFASDNSSDLFCEEIARQTKSHK